MNELQEEEGLAFGNRLLNLRSKAGYSQEQLGELLGVSRQAISRWESGQGKPEIDNIVKLAQIYRVSIDYVLTGEEPSLPVWESPNISPRRELPREYRFAISALAIIAGGALIFLIFIVVISLFSMVFFGPDIPGWS